MTNKVGPTGRLQCISAACHGRHADGRPLKPCGSTASHGEPLRGTPRQGAKARASLSRGRAGARSVSRRNRERASSIQQRPPCTSCSHGAAGALVRDKSLTQAHHADESAAAAAQSAPRGRGHGDTPTAAQHTRGLGLAARRSQCSSCTSLEAPQRTAVDRVHRAAHRAPEPPEPAKPAVQSTSPGGAMPTTCPPHSPRQPKQATWRPSSNTPALALRTRSPYAAP
jgi:hypothetical protein